MESGMKYRSYLSHLVADYADKHRLGTFSSFLDLFFTLIDIEWLRDFAKLY